MDFEELRSLTAKESDFDVDFGDDDELGALDEVEPRETERRFLGLRPVERMMLSIFLFLNVSILMLAFLLATGRLAL